MKILYNNIILLPFILILFSYHLYSEDIPSDRIVNWNYAGLQSDFNYTNEYNVLDFDFDNKGNADNSLKINDLINLVNKPAKIYFPEGTYLFTSPIILKDSIELIGFNANSTILNFALENENNLIIAKGTINNYKNKINITKDINFKSSAITTINKLKPESYYLIGDNDSNIVFSSWAIGTTGQIIETNSETSTDENNNILSYIKTEFRRNYFINVTPYLIEITPIKHVSISNLTLNNLKETNSQTSNILFQYAAICKVKCIKSNMSNFAHINITSSTKINVTGSYFFDAHHHGGGGQGYGIMIQSTSSENLVLNNIFEHLRHSMITQSGANGNVFAYNYSLKPYWTGVSLPEDSAGDMVCHGNYPYANLFEANIGQNIVVDNSHGINGPLNTYFRNRAENYGIFMNTGAGDKTNFIANEVTNSTLFKGLYILTGNDNYELSNNIKGTPQPKEIQDINAFSLYFNSNKIPFQNSGIGFPFQFNSNNNPAFLRYQSQNFVECHTYKSIELNNINNDNINPEKYIKTEIYNLLGNKVFETNSYNYKFTDKGLYFIRIIHSNKIEIKKILNY